MYFRILSTVIFFLITIISYSQSIERADGEIINKKPIWYNDSIQNESSSTDYIDFYQKYLSGSRGSKCVMYPSCSNYALKVFREKGFCSGLCLSAERLMRCGHEASYYNQFNFNQNTKLIDLPFYSDPYFNSSFSNAKSQLFAFSENKIKQDSILLFIQYLINTEQYNTALLEINRQIFAKRYRLNHELYINKLICLRSLHELESALYDYHNRFPLVVKNDPNTVYQASLIEYELQNYNNSNQLLNSMEKSTDTIFLAKCQQLIGLNMSQLENWKQAKQCFINADKFNPNNERLNLNLKEIEHGLKYQKKNPIIGNILSIVPGLGYAYSGHVQTAFTALLSNSALVYATYTSIKSKNYGIAIITSSINLGFYIGNIVGGGTSVKRFNARKQKSIIEALEKINNINH